MKFIITFPLYVIGFLVGYILEAAVEGLGNGIEAAYQSIYGYKPKRP